MDVGFEEDCLAVRRCLRVRCAVLLLGEDIITCRKQAELTNAELKSLKR